MLLLLGAHVGAPHSSKRETFHSGCWSLPFGFAKSDHSHLISFPHRVRKSVIKHAKKKP